MAGSLTDTWEKKFLDLIFRNALASATTPAGLDTASIWVALFTVTPSDSATGTEVTGGAYARVAVSRSGTPAWAASTGTTATTNNSATITFPTPTAGWGTVVAIGLCNSLAGALSTDLIAYMDQTPNKTINTGDTVTIAASGLAITLD